MPGALFDADARIVAQYPGYLRIACAPLLGSREQGLRMERELRRVPGISDAHANSLTGKVLVLFDSALDADAMLSALGLGRAACAARLPSPLSPLSPPSPPCAPQRAQPASWHLLSAEKAAVELGSDLRKGLSDAEAASRLEAGANLLPTRKKKPGWQLLLAQLQGLPVALLGASAAISLLTGGIGEALAIVAVLAMNAGIGYATEKGAEETIATLSELIDETVPAIRQGRMLEVASSQLVPGDLLLLSPGVHVAADARLAQAVGLMLDESALTGESRFVPKSSAALLHPAPLAARDNMAYMGTAVAAGHGLALVVATGADTELGQVEALTQHAQPPPTPIQRQLDALGNRLVLISSAICVAVFGLGLLRGRGLLEMSKTAISLAIAAVPEGLPTVATTSFARGLRQMRERQMLIRRLQAIETLGAVHAICFDKTGTLTQNRMSVVELSTPSGTVRSAGGAALSLRRAQHSGDLARLLELCVLSNENAAAGDIGGAAASASATEAALLRLALDAGVDDDALRARYPLRQAELRAEGRNHMRTLHALQGSHERLLAVKGSPLEVLDMCASLQRDGAIVPLSPDARERILARNADMAERQLRVLGFAYALDEDLAIDEAGLVWLGLVGMADPVRPEVERSIAAFHAAGIRTVMLTGDQHATAGAIGAALRLSGDDALRVMDADALETMGDEELCALANQADVFARVSPARKLQIVRALQRCGMVVAMTGDGINDGPALRAADIGIAMGRSGTDLARSAADVVLKDDRLETVLDAIRQGRGITGNIERSLEFLISSNLSEILLVLGAVATHGAAPLTPMQLLWINLLTDVLPAVALAAEPPEGDVMRHAPRSPDAPIAGKPQLLDYSRQGALLAAGTLGSYVYGLARHGAGPAAGSIAFNTLMLGQMLHAWGCRSRAQRPFDAAETKGRFLGAALGGSLALQLVANLLPGLRRLLGLPGAVDALDIAAMLAGAGLPHLCNEALRARAADMPAQDVGSAW